MKHQFHLLVIDPQNDFCDLPATHLHAGTVKPALPVPGAHVDMLNVANLIRQGGHGLSAITATIDSHHRLDIAHPTFWMDAERREVAPFTQIRAAEVHAGKFLPQDAASLPRALAYLNALEAAGRYTLMVWPVHCEMGSWGHQVHADVQSAFDRWEASVHGHVNYVRKGANPWTEHYSAIQAEVPDAEDIDTQLNVGLIELLSKSDRVFITGEAGSHCVRATTEHLADHVDQGSLSKFVLLTDCMSPVAGFESQQREFIKAMVSRGMRTATATEVLPELNANARR
jgi:nicotinamidase/pyrazinamidase